MVRQHQVVDDVGAVGPVLCVAEPAGALVALHDAHGGVNPTVCTGMVVWTGSETSIQRLVVAVGVAIVAVQHLLLVV